MIRAYAQRNLLERGWEIALIDEERRVSYTFEFKAHELKEGDSAEISLIPFKNLEVLKGLAEAFEEMELMKSDATTMELKATKYHLEDMRKLVFK